MPEETKPQEQAPAQSAATPAKAASPVIPLVIGIAVLAILAIGGIAAWVFMSQGSLFGNPASAAESPRAVITAANVAVKSYIQDLSVEDFEKAEQDPSTFYKELYAKLEDEAYEYDMTLDFAGKPNSSTSSAGTPAAGLPTANYKVNLQGKVASKNKVPGIDGSFDATMSASGLSFAFKGQYKLVNEKLYVKVTEGGQLFRLPAGWISIDMKDAAAQATSGTPVNSPSESEKQELEKSLNRLKSFQNDLLINVKDVANRTVKGESLKCAEAQINPQIATVAEDADDAKEIQDLLTKLTPYTICANGETKPVYYEIGANVDEGSMPGVVKVTMVMTKLASIPTFEAPAASEVTDYKELTGK